MSHSQLDRGASVNFIPGRAVAVDTTGRETSIEPRPHIPVASTRSTLHMPRGQLPLETRSRSYEPAASPTLPGGRSPRLFEPAAAPTLPGGRSPELRRNDDHNRNQHVSLSPRMPQDLMPSGPPVELLRRGNAETREAIATGRAHVIVCQGCRNRLHAPKNYSLVFCPKCKTISPELLADSEGNSSGSHGGRDGHLNR